MIEDDKEVTLLEKIMYEKQEFANKEMEIERLEEDLRGRERVVPREIRPQIKSYIAMCKDLARRIESYKTSLLFPVDDLDLRYTKTSECLHYLSVAYELLQKHAIEMLTVVQSIRSIVELKEEREPLNKELNIIQDRLYLLIAEQEKINNK